MIVAGFRHLASRGGDPQLHTHCVLANMTRNASGEWRSVEPTAIRRSEKLIGAYYRNELAMRLQAMGMAVTPTLIGRVPGFELAGYDSRSSTRSRGAGRRSWRIWRSTAFPTTRGTPRSRRSGRARPRRRWACRSWFPSGAPARGRWGSRATRRSCARRGRSIPATGKQVPPVEVPPPGLPANELVKLRRAPKLPPLPRDPGLAALGKAHAPEASSAADLSPAPETGVLEAVARAVEHVSERRTFIPAAEIRAVALGHAPGRYTLAEVDDAIEPAGRGRRADRDGTEGDGPRLRHPAGRAGGAEDPRLDAGRGGARGGRSGTRGRSRNASSGAV